MGIEAHHQIQISKTFLDGVLSIMPPTIFEDFRGAYIETYNKALYQSSGISMDFVEEDLSISYRNVLRGLHGEHDGGHKLCSCPYGRIYHVVVNNLPEHPQYHQWASFILTGENHQQILVPPGFGNGYLVLSEMAIFAYKQSNYYQGAERQFTLQHDDPALNIWWPVRNPIVTLRDAGFNRES